MSLKLDYNKSKVCSNTMSYLNNTAMMKSKIIFILE